jgi:hypothetical protein
MFYSIGLIKLSLEKFPTILIFTVVIIKLHLCDSILKLQAIVYNQFRSPRFKNFIIHAWQKSGLLSRIDQEDSRSDDDDDDTSVLYFDDPKSFCFDAHCILNNHCASCAVKPCFIRCAWCKLYYCFNHLFFEGHDGFHFCEEFIE